MYNMKHYGINPRTFGYLLEDVFHKGMSNVHNELSSYVPVNILETEKEFELQVFAPGIKKEDFKISVEKNILSISYDHKEESTENDANKWVRKEFITKSFKKSYTLNEKIDVTNIAAKFNDGILTVTVPKKELVPSHAHEVSVN